MRIIMIDLLLADASTDPCGGGGVIFCNNDIFSMVYLPARPSVCAHTLKRIIN